MTIKEIAEAAGCGVNTVKRWVAENMPGKMEKGKVTRFTWEESVLVMNAMPKRNNVTQLGQVPAPNGTGDRLDRLEAMVEKLIGAVATLAIQAPRSNVSALPAPSLVPDIPIRKQIVNLVNDYSVNFNGGQFEATWRRLYREFGDRYGMDVKARASHRGIKPIEYLEREGLLESLYLVAIAVLGRGVA